MNSALTIYLLVSRTLEVISAGVWELVKGAGLKPKIKQVRASNSTAFGVCTASEN